MHTPQSTQITYFQMEIKWLNEDLKKEVRDVFEPKYKRELSDKEVVQIALNLVSYMEHYTKFIWRMKHEQNN